MNARSHVGFKQLSDQVDSLLDAVVADGFVVVLDRSQNVGDLVRHLQLGDFDDLTQRVVALDWHHSRKDGHSDAQRPAVSDKAYERLWAEEELRDDEICSCIHLRPQIIDDNGINSTLLDNSAIKNHAAAVPNRP